MTPFEKFFIAHIIGDYLFQSEWMAKHKTLRSPYGFKWLALTSHSILYALSFLIIFQDFGVAMLVGIVHGIIDFFPITGWWLKLIRGRTFDKSIENCKIMVGSHSQIYSGITCVVYTWVDFAIHFLTTWPLILWR
jgi:hypothetical protein